MKLLLHIKTQLGEQKLLLKTLFVLGLLVTSSAIAWAQNGAIKGIVRDAASESMLTGARVTIESLRRGTITDVNGAFLIGNLPVGTHTLRITYLTYEDQDIEFTIVGKEVKEIIVDMMPIDLKGEAVVITAQALGQTQAINQQLNSDAIANIVSADRIQELPDVNAAEAIARLPGIAINRSGGEGQKIVIRGLEPKFAAITINGVNLPSNSSTDRSVDLSLIAPELLDGIEVFKSPLPDMDAEAVGGTVNLKLRKAPKRFKVLAKGLWGYNDLANQYRDYKGILQLSKRLFKDKLGFVFQGGLERRNRDGDIYTQTWRQGRTDSTGLTEILGNSLRLEDRQEIRRRYNTSLGLDYDLGRHQFALFGLYSRTTRDRFLMQEQYEPSNQQIRYTGRSIENSLDLSFLSLTGNHSLGPINADWTVASSQSKGETPFDFQMRFFNNVDPFDDALNPDSAPNNYFEAANPDLGITIFDDADARRTDITENSFAATLNLEMPFKLGSAISGSLKFGGKYKTISRERNVNLERENFYYLGASQTRDAIDRHDGEVITLPQNANLISISTFTQRTAELTSQDEQGRNIPLSASLDPNRMRDWYDSQRDFLNNDRNALRDIYEVDESVTAGYMMLKFKIGDALTIIPGFRYEYSDNEYGGGVSTINGLYGVNGTYEDTTTFQTYGEFLPHFHIKYKPFDWLDIRGSYAKTLARPDFNWITPRIHIDDNATTLTVGNPELRHAVSTNYDFAVTAYKGGFGLISFGLFYKEVENIFYAWQTFLVDQETADSFGYPDNVGYQLNSFTNSPSSSVFGYEVDFQTTLSFLPKPFNGLVFNINYSRLYSTTDVFFLTSEQRLIIPVPPIFETTYTNSTREVDMPSQAPHILRTSLGYDYKGFSARISAAYQGSKVSGYSVNKDFDTFTLDFWRIDASVKQKIGKYFSVFLNLENLNNQRDITFTRDPRFTNTVETYGFTGSLGLQFKL